MNTRYSAIKPCGHRASLAITTNIVFIIIQALRLNSKINKGGKTNDHNKDVSFQELPSFPLLLFLNFPVHL